MTVLIRQIISPKIKIYKLQVQQFGSKTEKKTLRTKALNTTAFIPSN